MRVSDATVPLDRLLLDPNNYRLDYLVEDDADVHDDDVVESQPHVEAKLEKERLGELRDSILRNGFLEVDRLVVRRLLDARYPDHFVVVEGNRRTAALKGLVSLYSDGVVDLPAELLQKIGGISVVLIEGTESEIAEHSAALMGIRHVSGPKKWTGYQSARLIADMERRGRTLTEIGGFLGITSIEAGRRLRAYHAVEQMKADKQYGPRVKSNHYALLQEFIVRTVSKEWLAWSDEERRFKNTTHRDRVYAAIAPDPDAGHEPEIASPTSARKFVTALAHDDLREMLERGVSLAELPAPPSPRSATRAQRLTSLLRVLQGDWDEVGAEESELLVMIVNRCRELLAQERGGGSR